MASSLNIIGNHQIEFSSGINVIEQFEDVLGIKVQDGTDNTMNSVGKTNILSEIYFYSYFNQIEVNYENHKMVKIITNYKYCPEITILRNSILYFSNILIKYWIPILLNELNDESRIFQYKHTIENWEKLLPFTQLTTKKLGGNQLIFLSDQYDDISDQCYEGKIKIQEMIKNLTTDYSPIQIKWIQNNELKNRLKFNWLNMKLINENNWLLDPNVNLNKGM